MRSDRGVLVMGEIKTAIACECSRCLKQFILPVRFALSEEYLPAIDVNTGLPLQEKPDDESLLIDVHHILDLGETVRQYAIINVPLKPLCRDACLGLCPVCGTDLNRRICSCPKGAADPRWAKLAVLNDLLQDTNSRK